MPPRLLFGCLACLPALMGCVQPLMKDVPIRSAALGTGRVQTFQQILVENPGSSERIGEAFLYGGVMGVAGAAITENDIGTSHLQHYKVLLNDGQTLEVNSFSVVAVNDCVTITPLPGVSHVIVERVDASRCENQTMQQP